MQVILNDMAKRAHSNEQDVLLVRTETCEIKVRYQGGVYGIYLLALKDGKPEWTKVARTEPTAERARKVAAQLYRSGM